MITIELKNANEVAHPFNRNLINDTLHEYLMKEGREKYKEQQFLLFFKGNFNETEKQMIERTIHQFYTKEKKWYKFVDHYDDWYRLVGLFCGTIFILFATLINNFVGEVLMVAGWVIVWEAFYDIFFGGIKRKMEYKLLDKLANSTICFEDEKSSL